MSKLGGYNQAIISNQRLPCRTNPLLAVSSQWYVRGAGMAAIERPFCLAVTDYEGARGSHCERWGRSGRQGVKQENWRLRIRDFGNDTYYLKEMYNN